MMDDGQPGPGDLWASEELDHGLLAQLRENYNAPPEPQLDAMWGRIAQGRLEARGARENLPATRAVRWSRRTGSSRF
jgi:hypothetical protein